MAFLAAYQAQFEREFRDVPSGALAWRLSASAAVPSVPLYFAAAHRARAAAQGHAAPVYFPGSCCIESPVYNRYALAPCTGTP